jgi:hypothetical protein
VHRVHRHLVQVEVLGCVVALLRSPSSSRRTSAPIPVATTTTAAASTNVQNPTMCRVDTSRLLNPETTHRMTRR